MLRILGIILAVIVLYVFLAPANDATSPADSADMMRPQTRIAEPFNSQAQDTSKNSEPEGVRIGSQTRASAATPAGAATATRQGRRVVVAGGVPGLSRYGAVRWMRSFNKKLDDQTATALATTILAECARRGVDSRLAFSLFAAESRFNYLAISPVGAIGLGQLMPRTAAEMGVKDTRDPHQNAMGAIRYIARLQGYWKGSPACCQLTLASYNAGAGAVQSFGGIPPYPETRTYVKRILVYYSQLQHID